MRLARPVYESLPYVYMAIGGLAIFLFYINPPGFAGKAAFIIGLFALTAGVTLFLRRLVATAASSIDVRPSGALGAPRADYSPILTLRAGRCGFSFPALPGPPSRPVFCTA